jgi:hypothetical protein
MVLCDFTCALSGVEGGCCVTNVRAATDVSSRERSISENEPVVAPNTAATIAIRMVRVKLCGVLMQAFGVTHFGTLRPLERRSVLEIRKRRMTIPLHQVSKALDASIWSALARIWLLYLRPSRKRSFTLGSFSLR